MATTTASNNPPPASATAEFTTTVTLRAQCLCRAQTFTASVPSTTLPLRAITCHCTSCRHATGAMRSTSAKWHGPAGDIVRAVSPPLGGEGEKKHAGNPGLRWYRFSPRLNFLFCGACGTKLFWEEFEHPVPEGGERSVAEAREGAEYFVHTGVLDVVDVEEGEKGGTGTGWDKTRPLLQWTDHIFVGDTLDGGVSCWSRGVNGDDGPPVKMWEGKEGQSEEVPPGWPPLKNLPSYETNLKDAEGEKGSVPVRCHCRGVDFVLRAGEAQRENAAKQAKGEELTVFVDPVTHKMAASMDCCNSCRIWIGSEIMHWSFSPLRDMSFAGHGAAHLPETTAQLREAVEAKDARLGTLAMYASSRDVQRYFCSRCAACVFYAVDKRPDMVDIAVGLLDSPDGARAESVLSWALGGTFSWEQDMLGTWREGLYRAFQKDSEHFRIDRGYPKNWRRVAIEEARAAQAAKM